jgi:hypothetical protein
MKTEFITMIPVLPSQNIERDVVWYREKVGFECLHTDHMYAVLYRQNLMLHLQWHADTPDDPLLGGSVIRMYAKNIKPLFDELVRRGTVTADKLKRNTPWKTNEFGFYDLNGNAVFVLEDAE